MKIDWFALAAGAARDAHENHFSSRRGIWPLDEVPVPAMVLYNNNPYAGDPQRRHAELKMFRSWLAQEGIVELGFGEFPIDGEEAGYSNALVIGAGEDRTDEVAAALQRVLRSCSK